MENDLLFIGAYLLDILFITILAQRCWKGSLIGVVVNLILVGFWAQKSVTIFGFESNLGNLFYAAVIYGMSIIAYRKEYRDVLWGMVTAYVGLAMFIVMCKVASSVPGEVVYNYELMQTFIGDNRILSAAFVAFFFGNTINTLLIRRSSTFVGKISANIVTQAFDSVIFFYIAFIGVMPIDKIIEWMLGGFIIKSLLNIIDTPIFLFVTRRLKSNN